MNLIYEENYWDDKKWFLFCQECLKSRYIDIGYLGVSYEEGLEFGYAGFNSTGKVFITFCQDRNSAMSNNEIKLNIKQRIKKIISSENGKALFYENFIIKDITIITHINLDYDTKMYFRNLEKELVGSTDDGVGSDFKIYFWDIQYFSEQIPTVLKSRNFLYDFDRSKITDEEIEGFAENNTVYMDNLDGKLQKLLVENDLADEIEDMKKKYIMQYLQGKYLMDDLAENVETLYAQIMQLIKINENKIKMKSMKKQEDKFTYLTDITSELEEVLHEQYRTIFHQNDICELNEYVISDWLMRCPLNFR